MALEIIKCPEFIAFEKNLVESLKDKENQTDAATSSAPAETKAAAPAKGNPKKEAAASNAKAGAAVLESPIEAATRKADNQLAMVLDLTWTLKDAEQ